MSAPVSASTPSRLAFASAALNLASLSCSTVPESSREGTDAGVADELCSGFLGGSGGTGVGPGSLLGGLDSFTMLGLMCFGTLPMGGVGFFELALVNFGRLGRDCGCQFDRTGCAYAA